jgi:ATP-dependent protease HslVU (ClpYQ) peptidase subunit
VTTIATDGKTMAGDGRGCVSETIVTDQGIKVIRLKDGLLGLSGRASVRAALAKFLNGKGKFPKDAGDWNAIHLTGSEARYYSSDQGEAFHLIDLPAACGSGREFAIGAMLAGASPREAVEIACQRDPFSGGTITEIEL